MKFWLKKKMQIVSSANQEIRASELVRLSAMLILKDQIKSHCHAGRPADLAAARKYRSIVSVVIKETIARGIAVEMLARGNDCRNGTSESSAKVRHYEAIKAIWEEFLKTTLELQIRRTERP